MYFEAVTTGDMYANGFDGLRFATVGAESNATFRAVTVDQGVFNVEYEVGTDKYNTSKENDYYNGSEMSEHKPGSDLVNDFFESDGEPGSVTKTVENAAKNIIYSVTKSNAVIDYSSENGGAHEFNSHGMQPWKIGLIVLDVVIFSLCLGAMSLPLISYLKNKKKPQEGK